MEGIVDFHTHILPKVDDGSRSMEETLDMLRMEAAQGIRQVVATPHFYAQTDKPEHFLARRAEAMEKLTEAVSRESGLPEVIPGAEVFFFRGISEAEILPELTIGESSYILIEMPTAAWGVTMLQELENIWVRRKIVPIIAHIDRYMSPWRNASLPERLAELPVAIQANADFFLRRLTAPMALRLFAAGKIHLLGSDCHNLSCRKPNLSDAVNKIEKHLGPKAFDTLLECQKCIF